MHPQAGSISDSDEEELYSYIEESIYDSDELSCLSRAIEFADDFFEEVILEEDHDSNRRVVRFAEYDSIQTSLHRNDYTDQEAHNVWYKRKEYDEMIRLARTAAALNDKDAISNRGLEAWTSCGSAKTRLLKESAIELVWNEQSKQWGEGVIEMDTESIRNKYRLVSLTAQKEAEERGQSDEDAVIKQKWEQKQQVSQNSDIDRLASVGFVVNDKNNSDDNQCDSDFNTEDCHRLSTNSSNTNNCCINNKNVLPQISETRTKKTISGNSKEQIEQQQQQESGYASWEEGLVAVGKL